MLALSAKFKITYFLNKDLGDNKEDPSSIKKLLTDRDDLEEISKITEMLNPDEKVLLVARHQE